MLSAAQARRARALLGWSSPKLAKRSMIGFDKVLRAQQDDGFRTLSGLDRQALRSAFETAGVEFRSDGVVQFRAAA